MLKFYPMLVNGRNTSCSLKTRHRESFAVHSPDRKRLTTPKTHGSLYDWKCYFPCGVLKNDTFHSKLNFNTHAQVLSYVIFYWEEN